MLWVKIKYITLIRLSILNFQTSLEKQTRIPFLRKYEPNIFVNQNDTSRSTKTLLLFKN